jgi:hypothetical protein
MLSPDAQGIDHHNYYGRSKSAHAGAKTICTSHVLAAFGIDASAYHYSGKLAQRCAILRRHGFAARSRLSRLPKNCSVGQARARILAQSWGDPAGTRYMIRVNGHALLLDHLGQTIVDTAPRKRDRRKILDIRAVFPKGGE